METIFQNVFPFLPVKDIVEVVESYVFLVSGKTFRAYTKISLRKVIRNCVPIVSCKSGFIFLTECKSGNFLGSTFSKQHRFCEISCPDTKTWDLCGLIEQTAENSSHQNRICLLWRLRREFLVCIYEFDSPQNGFTLLHKEILLNVYDDHPFENPEAGWSVWHLPNNDTII